ACPRYGRAARRPAAWGSVAGADVGVVVLHYVEGSLLGAGGPAVDADVTGDEVRLVVRMGALVLGDQTACPRVRAVVEQQPVDVLVGLVLVVRRAAFGHVVVFELQGGIRLFLVQQLVEGLRLVGVPDHGRPALRRGDPAVERVVPGLARLPGQGVGGFLYRVILEVGGLVTVLLRHPQLLSPDGGFNHAVRPRVIFLGADESRMVLPSYH